MLFVVMVVLLSLVFVMDAFVVCLDCLFVVLVLSVVFVSL